MLILAFTIQICVFPQIAFLSSAPNLLLIVVFVCSFIEGRERGMFYGLVAGLFMDLFYSGPFGFYTLFFINLGYVSGICNKYYYEDYITLPLLLSLASDLIYNLYIYVFRFLIRNRLNLGIIWSPSLSRRSYLPRLRRLSYTGFSFLSTGN